MVQGREKQCAALHAISSRTFASMLSDFMQKSPGSVLDMGLHLLVICFPLGAGFYRLISLLLWWFSMTWWRSSVCSPCRCKSSRSCPGLRKSLSTRSSARLMMIFCFWPQYGSSHQFALFCCIIVTKPPFGALLMRTCTHPGARGFSCFLINLSDILILRRFHGVEFHSFTDLPRGTICTTPHCICVAKCASGGRSRRLLRKIRLGEE